MRIAVKLLAAAAAAAAAAPRWHELTASYNYDAYLNDFAKNAPRSAGERAMREGLFKQRLSAALRHNSNPSQSWKRGINHMSDWTEDERAATHGYKPTSVVSGATSALAPSRELPASFDWRSQGVVTPVKDQGHCGSCWAFASTAVIESHLAISAGVVAELSPQQLVACMPNSNDCGGFGGCSGATADLAYGFVKEHGQASPYSFPYESWDGSTNGTCLDGARARAVATLDGFVKVASNNETETLRSLVANGPLAVNVAAMPWHDYEEGVFDGCAMNGSGTDIDHVVVLVGYDEDSLIIRNSWTPMWGEKGYIRLKRTAACGVDENPLDGTGCNGGPASVKVCGMCGVLYDTSYPTGVKAAA